MGKGSHGFTLVEMLITMIIISLVFLAFCDLAVVSVRTHQKADNEFIATGIAERRLETLRQYSFSALIAGTTTETLTELPGGQLTVTIGSVSGVITNSMRQIQVTVTWNATNRQATTGGRVRLDTIFAQSR
jgi:prepilin-type N-terminal cleavage/methylation domain-containing protein